MKSKRLLAFLLAAVMLLSLGACANDNSDNSTPSENQQQASASTTNSGVNTTTSTQNPPTDDTPSKDTVTVHAHVPDSWSPFCWAWGTDANVFDVWPGEAMSQEGGWYTMEVPNWVTGVIISNCGAPQTDDLTVEKGKEVWIVVEEDVSASVHYSKPSIPEGDTTPDENTVTVYAKVPANWLKPFCWAWSGSQNAFASWPGKAMTKSGDWYQIQVPNWIDSLILSNDGTPQTADLSVKKGKDLWVVAKANGEVTVYESKPALAVDGSSPHTLQHSDLKYVMVYNPGIYDERVNWNTNSLETGTLASLYSGQNLPQDECLPATVTSSSQSGNYKAGDSRQFYGTAPGQGLDQRSAWNMTCAYAGKHCYVWSDGSVSDSLLKAYGQEFDQNIYGKMVDLYGEVSWVGEQKLHLLFYPMQGGVGGYASPLDLVSSRDMSAAEAAASKVNLDHAVLHFNANKAQAGEQIAMYSTMAHEFQHLLCTCASLRNGVMCRTWLNEVMSAYTEDYFRSGIKIQLGFVNEYNNSYQYRMGTSLYHFSDLADAYGLVYCFGEYLTSHGGEDVFRNIHSYWRASNGSGLNEAKAIYNCVSSNFRKEIEDSFNYSGKVKFASKEEEWLSKLTLQFYLSMLSKDGNVAYNNAINTSSLLYTKSDATVIEGGGRIILQANGSFDIPGGADAGLVYIGLDKDFQVITSYIGQ